MGGHHSWRNCSAKVIVLGACLLAPPIVFSQGPPANGPAAPPPVISEPDPSTRLSPSQLEGLVVRQLILTSNRPPRRLSDMVMRVPSDNPITDAKAALGRRLFFDRLLSNDLSVSCATCHDPARAFADERPLAVGVFGRVGKRHSPALVNRGFGHTQFWDGRAATLEALVVQPIPDPNEMDLSLDDAVARLVADESYRAEFQAVFGRPVSADDLARALAWRADPETSTGAYQDQGRFQVTGLERDRGKFKTPTLREVARTAPYMHDGSLATLADVIAFYNTGGRSNPNLFPLVRPLNLMPDEQQALVAFLESLSGTVIGQ